MNNHNYLDELNPSQRAAAEHTEGPLLVLAGAGTGKTKVLTHRIAHIITLEKARSHNILAVTFTNKAAREMQERIAGLVNSVGLNLGTFHSVAARILRQYAPIFDLTSSFTIVDADDQLKLVKNLSQEHNIDIKTYTPKIILGIISRWKDLGLMPYKITDAEITSEARMVAQKIYHSYQSRLVQSNSVDFGDLLLYNSELFIHNPEILQIYQQKFKYILIDEYQDTNAVQYLWASKLAAMHTNLCCVGDDDQSIYSWRGAEVGNILRFERDFKDAKIIKLEQNYRSSMSILTAASSLIKNNTKRHGKSIWTERGPGEPINIVSCWSDKDEARFVVGEVSAAMREGKSANEIAILVRAGFQTRTFEEALISHALPYRIIGGLKFYDRMEIRDALGYIRVVLNEDDDIALERIINVPKRAVGDTTVKAIKNFASENGISMAVAIKRMLSAGMLKNKVHDSLTQLMQQFDSWRERYKQEKPADVTKSILEQSGYLAALRAEKTEESRARIENLNEMQRAMEDFENIAAFMEHTSLVMDHDIEEESGGAVSLMTLHASKGLEFDTVFLPGWEEGIFPHQKSLGEEGAKGLEEERRIAYVGITRAKKHLYITYAESRRIFHEYVKSIPSRFIIEIPDNISKKWNYGSNNFVNKAVKAQASYDASKLSQPKDTRTSVGTRVSHTSFGEGIIIRKSGDNLEIAFAKVGVKTIKESFVTIF